MKPGLFFTKIWSDDDLVELRIESSDGTSVFSNTCYVDWNALEETITGLETFREHIYGGIFNIRFGAFGAEYASGAFMARLHFQVPGTIRVTVEAQSDFEEFGAKKVASNATLFISSEPVLLDEFICELAALKEEKRPDARLKGV